MGTIYLNDIKYGGSGSGSAERELTKAEYEALSEEEKMNSTTYFITDGQGGDGSSEEIYSLEEQEIGKWIDGKTLYKRTFHTIAPTTTSWQTWDDMTAQLAAAGIKPPDVINMHGVIHGKDGATDVLAIMGTTIEDNYAIFKVLYYGTVFNGKVGQYLTGGDAYITFEYVK